MSSAAGIRHPLVDLAAVGGRRRTEQDTANMTDTTPSSSSAPEQFGSSRVKRGLAEMLKGGVIMDVVNAEQARIAEDAGAVAVMALERVPADIRSQGGVARMSDPDLIDGIVAAVSIPVMAKARIGHFVEAQILQEPRRRLHRRVRGPVARRLREPHRQVEVHGPLRLRCHEPGRGAAPHHRGRGDDPLQGRGGHRRRLRGHQAHPHHLGRGQPPEVLTHDGFYVAAKELQAPTTWSSRSRAPASCPSCCSRPAASRLRPMPR